MFNSYVCLPEGIHHWDADPPKLQDLRANSTASAQQNLAKLAKRLERRDRGDRGKLGHSSSKSSIVMVVKTKVIVIVVK